jgi:S-adenosylmethionine:tRNA ribosyltransferase-isomerase
MHSERISVDISTIGNLARRFKQANGNPDIIATGTTSLRTLESLYWIGAQVHIGIFQHSQDNEFFLEQWTPYRLESEYNLPSSALALGALHEWMKSGNHEHLSGRTLILIVPGYNFRIVNYLITNFHMPDSTLILLVAAFLGGDFWREAYGSALENGYRFLSYGDSSLLIRGSKAQDQ